MQPTSPIFPSSARGGTPPAPVPVGRAGPVLRALKAARATVRTLDFLSPLADLALRLYVAQVFFQAGLVKIGSWSATLSLFENEYAVPLLPPEAAAVMGTGVELFFPVLLVLGLGTRLAAFVLFVFNIIAVASYPDLGPVGLKDHQVWGLMLLVALLHGPGPLSLDRLIRRYAFKDAR